LRRRVAASLSKLLTPTKSRVGGENIYYFKKNIYFMSKKKRKQKKIRSPFFKISSAEGDNASSTSFHSSKSVSSVTKQAELDALRSDLQNTRLLVHSLARSDDMSLYDKKKSRNKKNPLQFL
jgi:hypothetical protein